MLLVLFLYLFMCGLPAELETSGSSGTEALLFFNHKAIYIYFGYFIVILVIFSVLNLFILIREHVKKKLAFLASASCLQSIRQGGRPSSPFF